MTPEDVQDWLDRYVEAWRTYDAGQVRDLFAQDIVYRYHPYDSGELVLDGRDAVVQSWVEPDGTASSRDAAGTYDAHYEPFAVDGTRAVAVGSSSYWTDASRATIDRIYDNVFLMEFDDDGRCRRFTDYFMLRPAEEPASAT